MLWLRKYVKIGPYGLGALLIIAFAAALRIALISLGWPAINSDEGTMGLMALHIITRGELPIYLYGQSYMGAIEAYIGAALFWLLGPSSFALRLGLVFLYVLFLLVMYVLSSLLYTKRIALITLFLLSLGSIETFTRQLKALGGDLETILFGALIVLIVSWLALSFTPDAGPARRWQRSAIYGCLGVVIGLALWSHMLIIPFVAVALLFLVLFCRRELFIRNTVFLLLGLLIGALPVIIFDLKYPAQNFVATLLSLHSSGGLASPHLPYTLWDGIVGTIVISLPMATADSLLYSMTTVPGQWKEQLPYLWVQGWWGLGFILLWLLAVALTLKDLLASYHLLRSPEPEQRQKVIRYAARLMLLGIAGLTLCAYLLSPAPALVPVTSSRYLVGLLVALPAIIAPLCSRIPAGELAPGFITALRVLRWAILLVIVAVLLNGTFDTFQQVPGVQATNQQQQVLVEKLLSIHAVHIYSDYWTCDRIIFQSDEQIICSVVNNQLQPGQNRYPLYQAIVEHDANATYVLPAGSPEQQTFAHTLAGSTKRYRSFSFEGYVIYQPENMEYTFSGRQECRGRSPLPGCGVFYKGRFLCESAWEADRCL